MLATTIGMQNTCFFLELFNVVDYTNTTYFCWRLGNSVKADYYIAALQKIDNIVQFLTYSLISQSLTYVYGDFNNLKHKIRNNHKIITKYLIFVSNNFVSK